MVNISVLECVITLTMVFAIFPLTLIVPASTIFIDVLSLAIIHVIFETSFIVINSFLFLLTIPMFLTHRKVTLVSFFSCSDFYSLAFGKIVFKHTFIKHVSIGAFKFSKPSSHIVKEFAFVHVSIRMINLPRPLNFPYWKSPSYLESSE